MPYCDQCGHKVSDQSIYCPNCGILLNSEIKPTPFNQENEDNECLTFFDEQPTPIAKPTYPEVHGVYGLGKAITGAIFSFVAFISSYIAIILFDTITYLDSSYAIDLYGFASIFTIFAIPFSIIAIVFGGRSISNFKYAKKNLNRVPIPTLILGIHGLTGGVLSAFLSFISLIMMIVLA